MTVPGSGTLSPQERVLTARVHTVVGLAPDTLMVKPLTPSSVDRYLRGEVSAGVVGARPPFDFRLVGGTVARHQDCVNLRQPRDFIQAFRLDYPGSPFRPDLAVVHTMEFPALFPDHYVVPFGAPSVPTADKRAVREAAYAMVDAVKMAGVDPNTYRQEIAPWPYSGTGLTAGGDLAMPEWWKRPGIVPVGARIVAGGAVVAVFQGASMGWEGPR